MSLYLLIQFIELIMGYLQSVADLGRLPPQSNFFSFPCNFRQKMCQIKGQCAFSKVGALSPPPPHPGNAGSATDTRPPSQRTPSHRELAHALFTLDVYVWAKVSVTSKSNIASMVWQTQMQRMGSDPFYGSNVNIVSQPVFFFLNLKTVGSIIYVAHRFHQFRFSTSVYAIDTYMILQTVVTMFVDLNNLGRKDARIPALITLVRDFEYLFSA